jgi:uncharacterized 2Fe-2S/4Fe-4S cluster protein (DUF4445 family)
MPRVTILRGSHTFDVRAGEQLLAAAWRAGVGIKSVCGGRGKCGSCRIEVDSDGAFRHALNPASDAEREWLPADALGQYRLTCQCEVIDDITISVPPESQVVKTAPRKPYTLTDTPVLPVVARVSLEVDGAYSVPPRSLATRVSQAAAHARAVQRSQLTLHLDSASSPARAAAYLSWLNVLV